MVIKRKSSPKKTDKKSKKILSKLSVAKVSTSHRNTTEMTLSDLIITDPNFRLFRKALRLTGLIDLLYDKNAYTVFAPSDEAFISLGDKTIDFLFERENLSILREILLYHFVPKVYTFSTLYTLNTLPTLLDIKLPLDTIEIELGDIRLSDSIVNVVSDVIVPDYIRTIII